MKKDKIDTSIFVGMEKDKALAYIQSKGWRCRVTAEDGKTYIMTMDICADRVNLVIENGRIKSAGVG